MKQASPAALSVRQVWLASSAEAVPARSRNPPEKGTIILVVPLSDGKRADSASHPRCACADDV